MSDHLEKNSAEVQMDIIVNLPFDEFKDVYVTHVL